MKRLILLAVLLLLGNSARAQIQVELKFKRLEYIAYEPVIATLHITNLAGRDIDLRDDAGQHWFGFEVTMGEGRLIPPTSGDIAGAPLSIAAGATVTRKINLTPLFPLGDLGAYHIRANVFFADLNKFYYSQAKVIEITDGRLVWQKTVGVPDGQPGAGGLRTLSLLTNRFPTYTALYVRVGDKNTGGVFGTYSLGRLLAFDEPHAELDRANELHVLHCAAPRVWTYSRIALDGHLLSHQTYIETKTRPRFRRTPEGNIAIIGGMLDVPVAQPVENPAPKLSDRPADLPKDN